MEGSGEPDEDELDLQPFDQPFDWARLLRVLLVAGLILWVLGGAAATIVFTYFSIESGFLATGSESSAHVAAAVYKISTVVGSIAFRTWIGAAVLLILLWYRTRNQDPQRQLEQR